MFLKSAFEWITDFCFPRVRGDVPGWCLIAPKGGGFSPRARGCSSGGVGSARESWVFPACAGMFLSTVDNRTIVPCFPRVRGDVPPAPIPHRHSRRFSPRARGCSAARSPRGRNCSVFPACAGMFRRDGVMLGTFSCFPRVRGDVPYIKIVGPILIPFSPRARGCSVVGLLAMDILGVFPACAGMFRNPSSARPW